MSRSLLMSLLKVINFVHYYFKKKLVTQTEDLLHACRKLVSLTRTKKELGILCRLVMEPTDHEIDGSQLLGTTLKTLDCESANCVLKC